LNEAQKGIRVLGELILFISTDKTEGSPKFVNSELSGMLNLLKKRVY